jgi:amidohydrolase
VSDDWIRPAVDAGYDDMVDLRRDLHAHPEIGLEEHRTTGIIRDRLDALGLAREVTGTDTGAVYSLDGGRPGATVVLRADIDALPVVEEVDLGYRSRTDGLMHACGHDEHTAAQLGVAAMLAARAEELPGRYVFVFQPGEELCDGAAKMLAGGALADIGPARLLGHHVSSLLPLGWVGVRAGVAMSEVHTLRVEVHGTGGHAAMPGAGDVVRAVAALAVELATVVDGMSLEGTDCVCTAGLLQAGTAPNVAPRSARLLGTLRTFTDEQRVDALGRLEALCLRMGTDYGVDVHLALAGHAPAVVNDPTTAAVVADAARVMLDPTVVGAQVFDLPPVTPSDDVSELMARVPGCYFFVGGAPPDGTAGAHHSPTFAIDDQALRTSALVTTRAALALAGST